MSDTTSMKNSTGSAPSNGDTISEITCKSTGKKLTQEVGVYQPKFISSAGTSPITSHANADTDALINGKSVLQFKNSKTDGQSYIAEPPLGHGDEPFLVKKISIFMVLRTAGGNNSYPTLLSTPVTRSISSHNYTLFSITDRSNNTDGGTGGFFVPNYKLTGNTGAQTAAIPLGYRHIIYHTQDISSSSMFAFTKSNNTSTSNNNTDGKYIITDTVPSAPIMTGLSIAHSVHGAQTTSWGGEIGEIIFFRTLLSDADVNAIGAYLSSKWGITYTDV